MTPNTIQQKTYDLGNKIRNFRLRAGLSQMKLEGLIDASPGSISRIENGEVNPTKETLVKIIDMLQLNANEASEVFGIDTRQYVMNIISTINSFHRYDSIGKVAQVAVNEIAYTLNLLGSFIVLVEDDSVVLKAFTNSWYSDLSMKIIGKPIQKIKVSINEEKNLMVKAIISRTYQMSNKHEDFLAPAVNKNIARVLERIARVKTGIAFPLVVNDKSIGAIYYGKSYTDDFKADFETLKLFSENVAIAISKLKT